MPPLLIGIAGGTGSGKTTVTERLFTALPAGSAAVIQHDWYYRDRSHLPPRQRDGLNFDEPDALDNDALLRDLIALKSGRSVECPRYDFTSHTRRVETQRIEARAVVFVEGILLFAVPALSDCFDLRLFVDTDDDIRLLRRIRRDVEARGRTIESIAEQYVATVRPMHHRHVVPSRAIAHLIIPGGTENTPALDVIVGQLLRQLGA